MTFWSKELRIRSVTQPLSASLGQPDIRVGGSSVATAVSLAINVTRVDERGVGTAAIRDTYHQYRRHGALVCREAPLGYSLLSPVGQSCDRACRGSKGGTNVYVFRWEILPC